MFSQQHLSDLKLAVGFIDHTALEGSDQLQTIENLCATAISPGVGIPSTAGVCVYPIWVETAKELLKGTNLTVASVSTAFPAGASFPEVKKLETKLAIEAGADEIDMVISRGQMLAGNHDFVKNEIREMKAIVGDKVLKVILETGELKQPEIIKKASFLAMEAGADFIKTSTGKISPAATIESSTIMMQAINEFHASTNKKIGFKPAGGIRTASDTLTYLALVRKLLSEEWLQPSLFRIGASSLTANLAKAITQIMETGGFSEDTPNKTSSY